MLINEKWFKRVSTTSRFRGYLMLFCLALGCNACSDVEEASMSKPNIVLIVADDLGYGDLSSYGATKIQTPAIDQLAGEGMKFDNAYAVSSLCSPSRYSILTGQYSWRTDLKYGVVKYYGKSMFQKGQSTLASMLKQNGYYTACIGKWHVGMDWSLKENAPENADSLVYTTWQNHMDQYVDFEQPIKNGPVDYGFDYFYGMAGSNNMQPYVHIENDKAVMPPSEEQKPYDHYQPALRAKNWDIKTINEDFTNKAVEVINGHFSGQSEAPLFLYYPTSAIHRPCLPTFTKGKSEAGLRGDIVVELDWTVREIVNALKQHKAYENTLFIFTSDNGPRAGDPVFWLDRYAEGDYEDYTQPYFDNYAPEYVDENGNNIWKNGWLTFDHSASGDLLGFKSDSWEGGLRVPFIVRWPGKVKGEAVNENMISTVDLMATLAEVVGESLEPGIGEDSYSFLSSLQNPDNPQVRRSLIITGGASGAMVALKDGWKYIEAAVPGRWPETPYDHVSHLEPQLYYLAEDEAETENLYEQMPEKVTELKELIEQAKNKNLKEASL
jgi:arylsulfatase A